MRSFSLLIIQIIIFSLLIPNSFALEKVHGNECEKSGKAGEEIIYHYSVRNDREYPIDILVQVVDYDWIVYIDESVIEDVNYHPLKELAFSGVSLFEPFISALKDGAFWVVPCKKE